MTGFPRVTIHKSTYELLEKEYRSRRYGTPMVRPGVQLVFSTHNGIILAYPDGTDGINPGSWYHLGLVLRPVYGTGGDFMGCSRCVGEVGVMSYPEERWDRPCQSEKVLYEIVIVPDDVPQDLSVIGWIK
jgi:hypothetical protein